MVDRRALLSYARANALRTMAVVRVLLAAGVAFDPSIGEAWTALVAGATLLLPRRARRRAARPTPRAGRRDMCARRPAVAAVELSAAELPALRVCLGGEAMAPALIRRWAAALPLHNIYGVTECTVYQASRRVRRREPEPPPTAEGGGGRARGTRGGAARGAAAGCTLPSSTTPPPVAADGGGEAAMSVGRSSRLGTSVSRSSPPNALSTSTASGSTSPAISRSGTAATHLVGRADRPGAAARAGARAWRGRGRALRLRSCAAPPPPSTATRSWRRTRRRRPRCRRRRRRWRRRRGRARTAGGGGGRAGGGACAALAAAAAAGASRLWRRSL